ncbi:MAG TPA: family 16 glycosylhydrolase, partial [Anaerolineales bacterium]|nr:family 16 glycosylhydrolase [Anaerolineales bacterium]
ETRLDVDLSDWHTYDLVWNATNAEFLVDGEVVLRANQPPDPPLGFVVWIDNQFAVLSRRDGVRFGVLPSTETQWLELAELRLDDTVMP